MRRDRDRDRDGRLPAHHWTLHLRVGGLDPAGDTSVHSRARIETSGSAPALPTGRGRRPAPPRVLAGGRLRAEPLGPTRGFALPETSVSNVCSDDTPARH